MIQNDPRPSNACQDRKKDSGSFLVVRSGPAVGNKGQTIDVLHFIKTQVGKKNIPIFSEIILNWKEKIRCKTS